MACPAAAHHIRGIPHYSYSENYPSAPAFEETREVGDFTLTMTYYEIPGAMALDLSLYIKDNRTGKVYDGDVIYAVYGEDESPVEAHSVMALKNKNNLYKAGWDYEKDGLYYVSVKFTDGEELIDEVFTIQMGETGVNYWFLGIAGGGVLLLIVAVALIKRAQGGGRAVVQRAQADTVDVADGEDTTL